MVPPLIQSRAVAPSHTLALFCLTLGIRPDFRPLWVSPRQVIVLPVAHAFDDYASEVASRLHDAGFYAEANISSETLNKRILEAQVAQWNYIVGIFPKDP